ncbi:MAG: sugar ABC transporter permease [Eubacteriales bacterium]|nr:sugar ABC transporter permease [Eubacteriales bacterium]
MFMLMEVPLQVTLGLFVAVLVSRASWFVRLARSVLFIPVVCSLTSISIIWSLILDPTIGIIPYYTQLLGLGKCTFLKDPNLAMPIIVFLSVWKNFGQTMVILLAGIQSINPTYYEAAMVEGAKPAQQFFRITLPLLLPNVAFCVITNLIGSMQVFDQVYVATRGGPMFRTETAVMYIYTRAFSAPFQLGYASAIATVLFVIIMILSLTLNRWFLKREEAVYA